MRRVITKHKAQGSSCHINTVFKITAARRQFQERTFRGLLAHSECFIWNGGLNSQFLNGVGKALEELVRLISLSVSTLCPSPCMPAAPWSSFGSSNAPNSFHPRTRVHTSILRRKCSMSTTDHTQTPASSFIQAALAEQLKSKRPRAKGYQDTEVNETLIHQFSPQHTDAVLRCLYKQSWYGTCLVVQWLRRHDPTQGAWVGSYFHGK